MTDKQIVNIHGKEYETVASRLARFIQDMMDLGYTYCLNSVVTLDGNGCLVRTTISIESEGKLVRQASGHAYEEKEASFINKTSYVENAETSAIGRCLSCLSYAGSEHICSANEVSNAIHNQQEVKSNKDDDVPIIDLPIDDMDLSVWKMPVGKYKEMTLSQIVSQTTDNGESKGLSYLEWFCEQTPRNDTGRGTQAVISKFLKDFQQ